MKAMILAAGAGTRVRPLTYDLPKPMIPILGKPVMEYLIEHLAQHGVRRIMVNTSHHAERIEQYFGHGGRFGLEIGYSFEGHIEDGRIVPFPLGSAGGLKRVQDFGGFFDETVVVLCGDALIDVDIFAAVREHREKKAWFSLLATEVPRERVSDYGVVLAGADGRIRAFQEKPRAEAAQSTLVNTGIYIIEPQVLDFIPPDTAFDIAADLFPRLLAAGVPFYAQRPAGHWIDIGRISDYWSAVQRVLHGEVAGIRIPGDYLGDRIWSGLNTNIDWADTRIEGPVYIGSGCRIEAGSTIIGPTWIGHGCHIERGAHVERSVVFEHTRVAPGAIFSENIVSGRYCVTRTGEPVPDADTTLPKSWSDARVRAGRSAAGPAAAAAGAAATDALVRAVNTFPRRELGATR